MADKVEKILDIKVNYNEAIKAIAEYQTKIDKAKEAESRGETEGTVKGWRHKKAAVQ